MCASYGLGGGPHGLDLTFDLPPMHEPESRERIAEWARVGDHRARITGRTARNLNPIIHAATGPREVDFAWWWLHIGGRPARFSAFNSRDDSLVRSWSAAFQRRAILPAHWYDEKGRTFALPGDELFGIAAIVNPFQPPEGEAMLSYSMVTRDAVGRAAAVHPRMPLLLPRGFHDAWLDPEQPGDADLVAAAVEASEELAVAVMQIDAGGSGLKREAESTLF